MEKKEKKFLHNIIWYMLIFSIIGLIIETLYCYVTTGAIESRKGLIIGPVCPIYGAGAVIIILGLDRFKNQKIKLFLYGMILGSLSEYIISFVLESIYGTRFWEYSYMKYQLNGRICILYTVFWGVLSLIMIDYVKPIVDKLIEKIKFKWLDITILCIFVIDVLLTIWGINVYTERVEVGRKEKENVNFIEHYKYVFEEKCFSNQIMSNIFPNIRVIDKNGNEVWISDFIK